VRVMDAVCVRRKSPLKGLPRKVARDLRARVVSETRMRPWTRRRAIESDTAAG